MDKRKLMDDIVRILILSRHKDESQGNHTETAEEIQNFEKDAVDKYLGVASDPLKINVNIFHATVSRDAALIFDVIDRYLSKLEYRGGER